MLGNNSLFLGADSSRRESRKRRRLSERRRVFGRLTSTTGGHEYQSMGAVMGGRERRRSSHKQAEPADDELPALLVASSDQGKIVMKIQFHITLAPDNEPLLLDTQQLVAVGGGPPPGGQQQQRQPSMESASAIGEHISERLSRQSSSTRRRQQLLAMHQQSALDKQVQTSPAAAAAVVQSEDNLTTFASERAAAANKLGSIDDNACEAPLGREPGARSSTMTSGMQDEATLKFLARQQPGGGLAAAGSSQSLLGQHQRLMSSSNNIRQRQEERQHIYFKRDGQRFGHEFTLKLAVDRSYRCLLKVRPLIPLEALTIQGHHVSFVDCSSNSSFSSTNSSGLGSSLSSSAPASSITLSGLEAASSHARNQPDQCASTRHNSIAWPANQLTSCSQCPAACGHSKQQPQRQSGHAGAQTARRHLNHAQTTIGSAGPSWRPQAADGEQRRARQSQPAGDPMGSSNSLASSNANARLQQQLLKQQQHHQMLRHFSAASSLSSAHTGGQLIYMFDWSANRFEVNKNKARTQVQTVLKFRNGQILSLPLQIKFYQPECRQHLSWGSQLHFIDYDCNIDSMGQMSVDRVQYY